MGSLGIVPNLGQIYNPDSFTGDGSEVDFTLTHLVTTDQSIVWVEGGVVQKPGIDFTISGLTLTRTTAPANLVACFAMYLGVSLDIGTPADGTVTLSKMAVNSVDSDQYVDGSIDAVHMSANSIDSDAYVDGSIDAVHMSANSVDSDSYVDASIDNAHLADDAVNSDELAAGAVDLAHMSATGTASSSTFLRGDNAWAAAGGGKLLQVVNATSTAAVNIGATEADTALTATITTTAANSKILVLVTQELSKSGMAVAAGHTTILNQAGSNVLTVQRQAGYNAVNSIRLDSCSFSWLSATVSSASTAVVFKTRGKHTSASYTGNMEYGHDSSMSTMTLIEIGA